MLCAAHRNELETRERAPSSINSGPRAVGDRERRARSCTTQPYMFPSCDCAIHAQSHWRRAHQHEHLVTRSCVIPAPPSTSKGVDHRRHIRAAGRENVWGTAAGGPSPTHQSAMTCLCQTQIKKSVSPGPAVPRPEWARKRAGTRTTAPAILHLLESSLRIRTRLPGGR
ncbi:hypothetical protein BC834DRAFT_534885 [Gloeopeniophorella convolvens]|nr:hypothetical protein BC834DRAFT_534885 [Gloeopeniophorella convolvens]